MADEDYKDGLSGRPHGRWFPTTDQTQRYAQGIRDRQTIEADNKTRNKDSSTTDDSNGFLEFMMFMMAFILTPSGLIYLIATVLFVVIFNATDPDMSLLWGLIIVIFAPGMIFLALCLLPLLVIVLIVGALF